MMIAEVGDDDYSRCKLRQTADKQPDNLECMQRNAWQHALHTLAKDKPYCILKSKYAKECFLFVEIPSGLASAKG